MWSDGIGNLACLDMQNNLLFFRSPVEAYLLFYCTATTFLLWAAGRVRMKSLKL